MRAFTDARNEETRDEIWIVEHPPVFTLGQAGNMEHLLEPGTLPVVKSDRGGQITYHGPGQIVVYVLLDLRRRQLGVRELVTLLEQTVIDLLAQAELCGTDREHAPGVYIDGAKIAALGLRVRRGRCYHGMALNVAMDLDPFGAINPCGFEGLEVTQLRDHGVDWSLQTTKSKLVDILLHRLHFGSRS
jgi:lipoyl(octanoyl) transferase